MENNNISRREFNSKLAKLGIGILSASVMPLLVTGKQSRSFTTIWDVIF
jgi:hypothetical protein